MPIPNRLWKTVPSFFPSPQRCSQVCTRKKKKKKERLATKKERTGGGQREKKSQCQYNSIKNPERKIEEGKEARDNKMLLASYATRFTECDQLRGVWNTSAEIASTEEK